MLEDDMPTESSSSQQQPHPQSRGPVLPTDYQCGAITRDVRCAKRASGIKDSRNGAEFLCSEHLGKRVANYGRRQLFAPSPLASRPAPAPRARRTPTAAPASVPVPQIVTVAPDITSENGNAAAVSAPRRTVTPRAPAVVPPVPAGNLNDPVCSVCNDGQTPDLRHVGHAVDADCTARCFAACTPCASKAETDVPALIPFEQVQLPPAAFRRIASANERDALRRQEHERLRVERQEKVTERLVQMQQDREIKDRVHAILTQANEGGFTGPQQFLEHCVAAGIPVALREPLFKPWLQLMTVHEVDDVVVTDEQREQWIQLAYGRAGQGQQAGFFHTMAPNIRAFREKVQRVFRERRMSAAEQAQCLEDELARLRTAAASVMSDPIAAMEAELPRIGYGGNIAVPMLLNANAETRLLKDREGSLVGHSELTGNSGVGKTFTMKRGVKALLPPECYIELDAMSDRVLSYDERSYKHKVLFITEGAAIAGARKGDDDNVAAVVFRCLLSENRIRYTTVVKDPESETGQRTVNVEKEGPIVAITAIVDPIKTPELASRFDLIDVPEDITQLGAALEAQADTEDRGHYLPTNPAILALRLLHQKMAEALGGLDVVVPYYRAFERLLRRRRSDSGILRDAARFLTRIKGFTLLCLEQRQRDAQGRYIATLQDYDNFFRYSNWIYESNVTGVSPDIRETVEVIKTLLGPEAHAPLMHVTSKQVTDALNVRRGAARKVDIRVVRRWLDRVVERGWVKDTTEGWRKGRGYSSLYQLGDTPLPAETALPIVAELEAEWQGRTLKRPMVA